MQFSDWEVQEMDHPACYGKMFPTTLKPTVNREIKGKVFGYLIDHTGVVASGRTVSADLDAFDECTVCRNLDDCSRLSAGKLLMEMAIRG